MGTSEMMLGVTPDGETREMRKAFWILHETEDYPPVRVYECSRCEGGFTRTYDHCPYCGVPMSDMILKSISVGFCE